VTHTPTLDPHRLDQLRTFLVSEAAGQVTDAQRRSPVRSRSRRLVVGAVATVALGGGLVAVSTVHPGGTDAALAITTEGEWTSVRMVDAEADPQAVVDELVAAGIDARIAPDGWNPDPPYDHDRTVAIVSEVRPEFTYGLHVVVEHEPGTTGSGDLFLAHGVDTDEGDDVSFSIRSDSDAQVIIDARE
jgi:hypothetical protein